LKKKLFETTKDALSSVFPITAVVFVLSVTVAPIPIGTLALFLFGALLLIAGMGLFTMGADMFLVPIGEDIGKKMILTGKVIIVGIVSFLMGLIMTAAEPDLQILAGLVPGVPNTVLVASVAVGVGIFLVLAIFRIFLKLSLPKILIVSYSALILLSVFVPRNFLAVAFDSGGVTTGPITVPFIMAMGLGLASLRGDRESLEDSFGLVALCSIGPIIAVMLLGIFYRPAMSEESVTQIIPQITYSRDVLNEFVRDMPHYSKEVAKSVWAIPAVVIVFQFITRRYKKGERLKLLFGFLYTFTGLVLFLTGVNVGFIPVGRYIGGYLAGASHKWLLIPLGAVIGYFIVAAEPAVHILKKQVEDISGGGIPGKAVQRYLSVGTAAALSISMLRVITGISVYWFLIPGYFAAIYLTYKTPRIFTGIAFDAGGVVSGPMTSTFLLPFAIGACPSPDRIVTDAFGLVALVALTPLIAIQLMGVVYRKRIDRAVNSIREEPLKELDIDFKDFAGDIEQLRR